MTEAIPASLPEDLRCKSLPLGTVGDSALSDPPSRREKQCAQCGIPSSRPGSRIRSLPPSPGSRCRMARGSHETPRSCSSNSPTLNGAIISRQLRARDQGDLETALATVVMQEMTCLTGPTFEPTALRLFVFGPHPADGGQLGFSGHVDTTALGTSRPQPFGRYPF